MISRDVIRFPVELCVIEAARPCGQIGSVSYTRLGSWPTGPWHPAQPSVVIRIIRRLQADGWVHVRTKGSHWQFKRPGKPGIITVPHPKKDLPMGTVRAIFRQAGWSDL